MKINGKRLLENLRTLATFTDTPGEGVTRFSYGKQDAKARDYILTIANELGASVRIDALQNIRLGLASNVADRASVIAGSHIDTVRNGGPLDGIYGVCSALEVLQTLSENSLKDLKYNYEVVIFAEEEGSGFGSTMTGSKFVAGIYGEKDLDILTNDAGESLRSTLARLEPVSETGQTIYNTTPFDAKGVIWDFGRIKTMLELHIEQGPILDRERLSLGVVESIFGMRVIEVTITGVGNHAGATPMCDRYDALCAAAECILEAERIVSKDDDGRTVVTVGKISIQPNCSNVIPESVRFTLEIRDKDSVKINSFMDMCIDAIRQIAFRRSVQCEVHEHSHSAPLRLANRLIDSMAARAREKKLPFKIMDSGAVHDACMVAAFADTGMIFVPSIGGRSHVPEENTNENDLIAGAEFLMDTVLDELRG